MSRYFIILCLLFTTAYAQLDMTLKFKNLSPEDKIKLSVTCPDPTKLSLTKKGYWISQDKHWRSGSSSTFINKLSVFIGAKFSGAANIGDMICIYTTKEGSFPIVLASDLLVMRPDTQYWVIDMETRSYLVCNQSRKACSFIYKKDAVIEKKQSKNIYKDLRKIKPDSKTPVQNTPQKRMPKVDLSDEPAHTSQPDQEK